MAKRRGREFFEVFRPVNRPEGQPGHAPQPSGGVPSAPVPAVDREAASAPPSVGSGKRGSGGGQAVIQLSRSSAGAVLLAMVFLIMVSHVWGVYRGRGQTVSNGTIPLEAGLPSDAGMPAVDEVVDAGPSDTPAPPSPRATAGGQSYVLLIATYRNPDHAHNLRAQLREQFGDQYRGKYGFHFIEVKVGTRTQPAVGVGPLDSHRSSEAEQLQREFRTMDFRNQTTPFKDAYFVPVESG